MNWVDLPEGYGDAGDGCRFWCWTILHDMVEMGIVQKNAVEVFDAFIAKRHIVRPAAYSLPTLKGAFYSGFQ